MKQPTLEEVTKQFMVMDMNSIEAEKFYNYYSMMGWKIKGKYPMKSWKHAARNWKLKLIEFAPVGMKKEYTYQEVVNIHGDWKDKRSFSMFQRTPTGTWVER